MIYGRSQAMTVAAAVTLAAGCGTFTNISVAHQRLKVSADDCVTENGTFRDFEFRVATFNDDGSVELTIDEVDSDVRLLEGQWVDLPLLNGLVLRRMRLISSEPSHGHVEIEYEYGVESGVPFLRHL